MAGRYRIVTYEDELLTDKSVHRMYDDGSREWRRQLASGRVAWQDSNAQTGIDELLGDEIIKRTFSTGRVIYAREQGYGRTAWADQKIVTINRSTFVGQVGALLARIGAGILLTSVTPPPVSLGPKAEEQLRQQTAKQPIGTPPKDQSNEDMFHHIDELGIEFGRADAFE